MASVVAAQFTAGGKTLEQPELDKICAILNISEDIRSRLPVGPSCTYYLHLSTNAQIPDKCAEANKPIMTLLNVKPL